MEIKLLEVVKNHEREIKQVLDDYIDIKNQSHVFVTQCARGFLDVHLTENDIPRFDCSDWVTSKGDFRTVEQPPLVNDFNTTVVKINLQQFSYEEIINGK